MVVTSILAVGVGLIEALLARKLYGIRNKWIYPIILLAANTISILRFGLSFEYCRIIAFAGVCVFFSVKDIIDRKISDVMHLLIFLLGCLNLSGSAWKSMLIGLVVCGLPMLLAAISKSGGIGGADIKCMAAIGWTLGYEKGIATLIVGLTLSLAAVGIIRIFCHKKISSVPMLPFFCTAAFLLCLF